MFTRSCAESVREKSTGLSVNFPLSTWDISSMSFIKVSRWLLASDILPRQFSTLALSSMFFSAIAVSQTIAFIVVLISWLIDDKNCVFAEFAFLSSSRLDLSFLLNDEK